jgi:hypothetical protein
MFNEMPTLQPANQHRQSSWSFDIKEKGVVVSTKREEGRKAKRTVYEKQCKGCDSSFKCGVKAQPYCSHECYSKHISKITPIIPCMVCLQSIGYGIKAIGRIVAMGHTNVKNAMVRVGVYNPNGSNVSARRREIVLREDNAFNDGKSLIVRRRERTGESDLKTPIQRTRRMLRSQISRVCMHMRMRRNMRTEEYLGCSFEEARCRIESQFTRGMTWTNYGSFWHLDHIVPLSSFDLNDSKQRMLANHVSNLQPLKAKENLKKGNKIPAAHQFDLVAN